MRHGHSSIDPAVVHRHAREALRQALEWRDWHSSFPAGDVLRLLLLMAARRASLFATVRRFFSACHETARRAVRAQLPNRERLTAGLVDALHGVLALSRRDRRRSWLLAIDTHNVGYYGRATPGLIGGPKKQGTKRFFGYATAVLLHERRRYTVGVLALSAGWRPHAVVAALLGQVGRKGLKIKGVTMDAAFGGGETIRLLQGRRLAYAIPLQRVGRANSARDRLFEGRHKQVRWAEWKVDRTGEPVRTRTLLWKGSRKTMLFAFGGWAGGRVRHVHRLALRSRELYRRRFGIETSYRQKNQGQAWTTSKDPVYRLLLEGVAYLLRQVWVVLTEWIALSRHARPGDWVGDLPLADMLDWLADELRTPDQENLSIPVSTTHWGDKRA